MENYVQEKRKLARKEILLIGIFSAILIYICVKDISSINMISILGDEYGYWGNAAFLAGYNWETVGLGSYYSYGYSFLLVPIMLLSNDPVVWYHYAILLNALFMVLSFWISVYCGRKLFAEISSIAVILCGFAVAFYPNTLAQTQFAWSETLLYFLFWCIFGLLTRFFQSETFKFSSILLICVLTVYLYMVHQRTIGVLFAVLLMSIFLTFRKALCLKTEIFLLAALGVGILLHAMVVQPYLQKHIWSLAQNAEEPLVNTYESVLSNIFQNIVNLEWIKKYFDAFLGQGWNLVISSFLLLPIGIFFVLKRIYGNLKSNDVEENHKEKAWLGLFLILALFFTMVVSALAIQGWPERIDGYIYGRYIEFCLGPLLLIGLLNLCTIKSPRLIAKPLVFGSIIAILIGLYVIEIMPTHAAGYYNIICSVSQYYWYSKSGTFYLSIIFCVGVAWLFVAIRSLRLVRAKRIAVQTFLIVVSLCSLWNLFAQTARDEFLTTRNSRNEIIQETREQLLSIDDPLYCFVGTTNDEKAFTLFNVGYLQYLVPNKEILAYEYGADKTFPQVLLIGRQIYSEHSEIRQTYPIVEPVWTNYYLASKMTLGEKYDITTQLSYTGGREISQGYRLYKDDMQYGPYITLTPGIYEITITGENLDRANCYATAEQGEVSLSITDVNVTPEKVTYQLLLMGTYENVEFCTLAEDGPVTISSMEIQKK